MREGTEGTDTAFLCVVLLVSTCCEYLRACIHSSISPNLACALPRSIEHITHIASLLQPSMPKPPPSFKRVYRKAPMEREPPRGKRKRYPAKAENGVKRQRTSRRGISSKQRAFTVKEVSVEMMMSLVRSQRLSRRLQCTRAC